MSESRRIRAEGRLDAPIALIGEAGGEHEERLLRPFCGASGHKLTSWWQPLGLRRADHFWIDNVYPFRPPNNDLGAVDLADLITWATDLHERIAQLTNVRVIVPTGNTALRTLMRRALDDRELTITKYRGSILRYRANDGREIKCIPTIHPASIYHQRAKKARGQEKSNPGRIEKHIALDWQRIAHEMTFAEVAAPHEDYYLVDRVEDVAYWRERFDALDPDVPVTIDIETPFKRVDCVGFAWDARFAIALPLRWPGYDGEHPTYAARRAFIEHVCASPNPKVFQYGACAFDVFYLTRQEGIIVENAIYDLKYMHHVLDPVDDHDLGYMKSIFLRGEYHKDEAKGEKAKRYADSYDACLTYNGMDCCTQIALFYELRRRLIEAGRWTLYETAYAPLLPILARMMLGGIATNRSARALANAQLTADCIDIQEALRALAGYALHTKRDLSHAKIKQFLYETLKLPPIRERGDRGRQGATTSKEVALRKLQLRHPQQCGEAVRLILDHRRKAKLASFLTDTKTDDDGRLRCVYEPVTEAGRLSSAKNPFGTGMNLQNQDRDERVRASFVPDTPEHLFLELDLSQAESRIVYVLSGDDALYHLATLGPDVFDQHSYNAHCIFRARPKRDDEHRYKVVAPDCATVLGYVSFEQRYLGKRVQHGYQRGMGKDKLADLLLMDDIVETPDRCGQYLARIAEAQRGTQQYFEWVQHAVLRERALTNSWGFRWDVRYEQMNSDLYRRAFSFLPQSEVAFLLNVWGLIPLAEFIDRYDCADARIALQVHDSVLVSVPRDAAIIGALCECAHASLTRPRTYTTRVGPRDLAMPVTFKLGRTWAFSEGHEWKRLPTREDLAAALEQLACPA